MLQLFFLDGLLVPHHRFLRRRSTMLRSRVSRLYDLLRWIIISCYCCWHYYLLLFGFLLLLWCRFIEMIARLLREELLLWVRAGRHCSLLTYPWRECTFFYISRCHHAIFRRRRPLLGAGKLVPLWRGGPATFGRLLLLLRWVVGVLLLIEYRRRVIPRHLMIHPKSLWHRGVHGVQRQLRYFCVYF